MIGRPGLIEHRDAILTGLFLRAFGGSLAVTGRM
jgi:hypothetical protein